MIARSLMQVKNSLVVNIPQKLAMQLGLKKGDFMEFKIKDGNLIINKLDIKESE